MSQRGTFRDPTSGGMACRPWPPPAGASRRARLGAALALLLGLTLGPAALASTLTIERTADGCRVHGSFVAAADRAVAWAVITDYEDIPRFVKAVRSSRLERGPDGVRLLRQKAEGGVLFLHETIEVLLELTEDPERSLAFRDRSGDDFSLYSGAWRLAPDSAGTRVDYDLTAEPRGVLARALCRSALRRSSSDLLEQVRAEILRRAASSGAHGLGSAPGEH